MPASDSLAIKFSACSAGVLWINTGIIIVGVFVIMSTFHLCAYIDVMLLPMFIPVPGHRQVGAALLLAS